MEQSEWAGAKPGTTYFLLFVVTVVMEELIRVAIMPMVKQSHIQESK